MMALNLADDVIPVRGKITITNSTLVSPEDGVIRDYGRDVEYTNWPTSYTRGQMVVTPIIDVADKWAAASEVVISPVEQKEEPKEDPKEEQKVEFSPVQKAYASISEGGLAQTGDAAGTFAGAAAAVAAAAAAVGATAVCVLANATNSKLACICMRRRVSGRLVRSMHSLAISQKRLSALTRSFG